MRVGIVGAGISGLLCAQRLLSLQQTPGLLQVTVFEWGRGPGGRTARRRVTLADGTEVSFDHAAPCFRAQSPEFKAVLRDWQSAGHAAAWSEAGDDVWIGTPSNHAICRMLAAQVSDAGGSLLYGRHVLHAQYDSEAGEWSILATNRQPAPDGTQEERHRFDALVFSDKLLLLPNPYAVLPAAEWGPLALPSTLTSTGAVVLMLALERPVGGGGIDGTPPPPLLDSGLPPPLKLLVHDSAKPGRHASAARAEPAPELMGANQRTEFDLWVAHSTASYAAEHLKGDDPL
jgi:hypothetical protein